jgi:hypothetical protein
MNDISGRMHQTEYPSKKRIIAFWMQSVVEEEKYISISWLEFVRTAQN